MSITIYTKVLAIQNGLYRNIVFLNLDKISDLDAKYITLTVCPNWEGYIPKINDIGFVEYKSVNAGDEYFHAAAKENKQYNYTANYFIRFIKEEPKQEYKSFKF